MFVAIRSAHQIDEILLKKSWMEKCSVVPRAATVNSSEYYQNANKFNLYKSTAFKMHIFD